MRLDNMLPNWRAASVACVSALVLALSITPAHPAQDWVRKTTSDDWTWFEDYVFAWATYVVACEPGRTCQVGMGISMFGEPRGEKLRFTGEREITVIGAGAIHMRPADGKGPVKAALAPKKSGLISVTWNF